MDGGGQNTDAAGFWCLEFACSKLQGGLWLYGRRGTTVCRRGKGLIQENHGVLAAKTFNTKASALGQIKPSKKVWLNQPALFRASTSFQKRFFTLSAGLTIKPKSPLQLWTRELFYVTSKLIHSDFTSKEQTEFCFQLLPNQNYMYSIHVNAI